MTANVIKSGTAITFAVVAGENGAPVTAQEVDLVVYDDKRTVLWQSVSPVVWADALASGVTFPAAASEITADQEYRIFGIVYRGAGITRPVTGQFYTEIIVESGNRLRPLENSFATWGQLMLEMRNVTGAKGFNCCAIGESEDGSSVGPAGESNPLLMSAFINAYHNIGYVTVDFFPPRHRARWRPQDRMWDGDGIFDPEVRKVHSTRQLTPELWAELQPWQREALIRAQVIEANFLLSGNTVEKQRYSGLMSHSAGESAHFYRAGRPLELPVCRAAANALKGIITYVTRIGG